MTKRIVSRDKPKLSNEIDDYEQSDGSLTIKQKGTEIVYFYNKSLVFYPEFPKGVFYQFILIQGTGNRNHLYVYGGDISPEGNLMPFLISKEGMLSTVLTVRPEIRA